MKKILFPLFTFLSVLGIFYCYFIIFNVNNKEEFCFLYLKNECINDTNCKADVDREINKPNIKLISSKELVMTENLYKKQYPFLFSKDIYESYGEDIIGNVIDKKIRVYLFSCKDCMDRCINIKYFIRKKYAKEYLQLKKNNGINGTIPNFIHCSRNNEEVCNDTSIFIPEKIFRINNICTKTKL